MDTNFSVGIRLYWPVDVLIDLNYGTYILNSLSPYVSSA